MDEVENKQWNCKLNCETGEENIQVKFQLPGPINSIINVNGIITQAAKTRKHPRRRRGDTAVRPIVCVCLCACVSASFNFLRNNCERERERKRKLVFEVTTVASFRKYKIRIRKIMHLKFKCCLVCGFALIPFESPSPAGNSHFTLTFADDNYSLNANRFSFFLYACGCVCLSILIEKN